MHYPGTLKTMSGTNPMTYLIMSMLMHDWIPRGKTSHGTGVSTRALGERSRTCIVHNATGAPPKGQTNSLHLLQNDRCSRASKRDRRTLQTWQPTRKHRQCNGKRKSVSILL